MGLQVGSHQSGAEGQNHLPQPAGHSAFDTAQDTVGLLGCKRTLEGHLELDGQHFFIASFYSVKAYHIDLLLYCSFFIKILGNIGQMVVSCKNIKTYQAKSCYSYHHDVD